MVVSWKGVGKELCSHTKIYWESELFTYTDPWIVCQFTTYQHFTGGELM